MPYSQLITGQPEVSPRRYHASERNGSTPVQKVARIKVNATLHVGPATFWPVDVLLADLMCTVSAQSPDEGTTAHGLYSVAVLYKSQHGQMTETT